MDGSGDLNDQRCWIWTKGRASRAYKTMQRTKTLERVTAMRIWGLQEREEREEMEYMEGRAREKREGGEGKKSRDAYE